MLTNNTKSAEPFGKWGWEEHRVRELIANTAEQTVGKLLAAHHR